MRMISKLTQLAIASESKHSHRPEGSSRQIANTMQTYNLKVLWIYGAAKHLHAARCRAPCPPSAASAHRRQPLAVKEMEKSRLLRGQWNPEPLWMSRPQPAAAGLLGVPVMITAFILVHPLIFIHLLLSHRHRRGHNNQTRARREASQEVSDNGHRGRHTPSAHRESSRNRGVHAQRVGS